MSTYDITFEDKEDLRDTGLPRKNTVTAADLNEIKNKHNQLAAATPTGTPTLQQVLTAGNESTTGANFVATGTPKVSVSRNAITGYDNTDEQKFNFDAQTGDCVVNSVQTTNGVVKPYKEAIFVLDADSGGGNPASTQAHNDFGAAFTFTRASAGVYFANADANIFSATAVQCNICIDPEIYGSEFFATSYKVNATTVRIHIYQNLSGLVSLTDGFQGTLHIMVTP